MWFYLTIFFFIVIALTFLLLFIQYVHRWCKHRNRRNACRAYTINGHVALPMTSDYRYAQHSGGNVNQPMVPRYERFVVVLFVCYFSFVCRTEQLQGSNIEMTNNQQDEQHVVVAMPEENTIQKCVC
jgi:hypothetical protein